MTRSSFATRRRVALPLAAALAGSALSLVAAGAAHADTAVDKSFNYACKVYLGTNSSGMVLNSGNPYTIGVETKVSIPDSVYPGQTIASRPVSISLTLPEELRAVTVGLLQSKTAAGSSKDAAVTYTTNGKTQSVAISNLAAPATTIPTTAGAPWVIPAAGTVPASTVDTTATGTVAVGMPTKFSVVSDLVGPNGLANTFLDCAGPADLALSSIPVVAAPVVTTPANRAPVAKKASLVTKKNKAKSVTLKATDADGDALTYKVTTKSKKGTAKIKGSKLTFKPKKNFVGKTAVVVTVSDGKGGTAKIKVAITVKKK